MASTFARSFVKGISWESITLILTTIAVYIVYGNFLDSLLFAFVLTFIKIGLYFIHERIWKRIRWGKYHIIDGKKVSS